MVEQAAAAKYAKLSMHPTRIMIDLSFWLAFTKRKLDEWKLEAPWVEIKAHISLPGSATVPQDLIVNEHSFQTGAQDGAAANTLGGLIQSEVSGLLVHTNTIEEYEAFDLQNLAN